MDLLRPFVRQFPFDDACIAIFDALERRRWRVPGVIVEIREIGTGEHKFRQVTRIDDGDFLIEFSRLQRDIPGGRLCDLAAASTLSIPRKILRVYGDESPPSLRLYVGDDWGRERDLFVSGSQVNSKLQGEPRTYLLYRGGYAHAGNLLGNDDLGREYAPTGDEPKAINAADVMHEIARYLSDVALPRIASHPMPELAQDGKDDEARASSPPPFPAGLAPIFCFGTQRDVERIRGGQRDASALHPADRYGMLGEGARLVPIGATRGAEILPSIALEGFLWCGVGDPGDARYAKIYGLCSPWFTLDATPLIVKPKTSREVYVADHAAYERRRSELMAALGTRDSLTNEEVNDVLRTRGQTIVPADEYQGGFETPIVLVRRELGLDEVEVMDDPIVDH